MWGKLTRSRVLWDRMELRKAPRSRDGARKFSPSCKAGQDKTMQGENKDPIIRPCPTPLPSLDLGHIPISA